MILVTGGAGFIGSNLVAALEERGHGDIVISDRLGNDDKWRNIAKREVREMVKPENLISWLENYGSDVDTIFHMGAISSTTERDADLIVENNFILSRRLWKWCAENDVRFIYASSAATYGMGDQGFSDEDMPEALARLRPMNPYGWSKHAFDRSISRIIHSGKKEQIPPQWAGLKFFNVYGPNEYHKGDQMSVACKLFPQVVAGAAAKLFKSHDINYDDGGQIRDFIYVDDCVDVMLWLFDNPKVSGLYNVGTGQGRTFNDLANAVFAACRRPSKINYIDMPESLQDRYQYYTQADVARLRAAGYKSEFTSLEDGIGRYVRDYLTGGDPYR